MGKFELGLVVATPGALEALKNAGQPAMEFINRHVQGDWGDVGTEDTDENEVSLTRGFRILSAYILPDGTRIWIITEADRSSTCLLLPSEYKEHKETEWSNVIAWNGLAAACDWYLQKGRLVFVEGYLKTDWWSADGVNQRRTFIVATDIRFIPTSSSVPAREFMPTEDLPADLGQPAEEATAEPPKRKGRQKQPAA